MATKQTTENTEETTVETVEVEAQDWVTESLTPYRLAEHVSRVMSEELGEDITIAPQAIYGAVRSGSLEVGTFDSGHQKVTPAKANAYIAAKLSRALTKRAKAEAAEKS